MVANMKQNLAWFHLQPVGVPLAAGLLFPFWLAAVADIAA
jgi:cation transport ATPase